MSRSKVILGRKKKKTQNAPGPGRIVRICPFSLSPIFFILTEKKRKKKHSSGRITHKVK